MNKGLEALETLKLLKDFVLKSNKNGLDRRFIIGSCNILEKELKAFEIIVKKDVHITLIKNCENAEQYNRGLLATMNKTTAKKYNLLDEQFNAVKEVLA